MDADRVDQFRRYLESIPDDLLAEVTEDFRWLASAFADERAAEDFRQRMRFCSEECARRGWRDHPHAA